MKKLKIATAVVLRCALLLSPGMVFAFFQWGKLSTLINLLAAFGIETLALILFSLIMVVRQTAKDKAQKATEQPNQNQE